ncbi:serine/threonine protein kinase [Myxococcota bacterium]|nr:serine/threonine protein kinase [Myxococcota bacterium]
MASPHSTIFGPYFLRSVVASSERAELAIALTFVPDGSKPLIALRRLRGNHDTDATRDERFLLHAGRYAVLRHPNIAEVKDLGSLEGTSYVAVEWVQGRSLLSALAACGRLGIGFPTDVALFIVAKTLDALEYAHAFRGADGRPLGIVHGDLRHSNVLLASDGQVKVSDFELGDVSSTARTERGTCVGGRHGFFTYLAPEQVRAPDRVDARADVFGLGVLLYELVTGRHLLSDPDEDALLMRLEQSQFDVPITRYRPDLHPELESIIRTALAPEPSDRFGSAAAFRDALGAFLASVGVAPGPEALRQLLARLFPPDAEAPEAESE